MSRLSVILPTLNEERHAGSLLSDMAAQTKKPDEGFFEGFHFERRPLDVACPRYMPYRSTPAVKGFHALGKFGWVNRIDHELGGHES